MSEPYPISLVLRDEPVAVIGGGTVAERKVLGLLDTGARITVIAPQVTDAIKALEAQNRLVLQEREVIDDDLYGLKLIFVATGSDEVNRRVSRLARQRGILVNCVDTPEECSFYVPSFFRRGSLTFTISTGGKIPALAKRLRKVLESSYDEPYAAFVAVLAQERQRLIENQFLTEQQKREILEELIESRLFSFIQEGRSKEAARYAADFIDQALNSRTEQGGSRQAGE